LRQRLIHIAFVTVNQLAQIGTRSFSGLLFIKRVKFYALLVQHLHGFWHKLVSAHCLGLFVQGKRVFIAFDLF
jgi:hypothetical protein